MTLNRDTNFPAGGWVLSRREILAGGAAAGATLLLAGCQSGPSATGDAGTDAATPVWPDQANTPYSALPTPPSGSKPAPTGQAPTPSSVSYGLPPNVIPRSTWTSAGVIRSLANPMNGVNRITVHHDAIPSQGIRTQRDAIVRLNSVRQSHLREGWADIGYHYVIDPQGRVWEARPLVYQGAHVKDKNEHNIGVMCMGNFEQQTPTPQQTAALDAFVASLMQRHKIPANRVYTHQELGQTACPGRNLQRYMLATRSRGGKLASVYV
ncbi:MAG: peptidoglycan recognition family protein [Phycisphaerales bacterium]|nr:N-acetylmuramoyl-L-alanine amidase [Planctomycetota bacterium]